MTSLELVGISGKLGSGKDAVGSYLENKCGFQITRFASIIKQSVALITQTTVQENYDNKSNFISAVPMTTTAEIKDVTMCVISLLSPHAFAEDADYEALMDAIYNFLLDRYDQEEGWVVFNRTLGQLQHEFGMHMRENVRPLIWCEAMEEFINTQVDKGVDRIVVVDARFPDEVDMLKRMGARIIRIERDRDLRQEHAAGRSLSCASEVALDDYPFEGSEIVQNNSSLGVLLAKVRCMLAL